MACSFCGLDRRQVAKLIAGPKAFICDACVRLSKEIIDREGSIEDRVGGVRWVVLSELASLPPRTPRAMVRKLVLAAIALCEDDPAALRQLASAAWSANDPEGGVLALRRIPEADRTADDVIAEAVHHDTMGAYAVGIALLDALDPATLSPSAREIVPLHRAVMQLAGGLVKPEDARGLERFGIDFVQHVLPSLALDDGYRRALEREALLVQARAVVLAGELTRAEAMLREHLLAHEKDAEVWALLFDIHHARGEHELARTARARALEHAHPEGPIAARLRDATIGPFR
ncbi:ClpX C4-type zinc finger protein [Sandaracinus amylolyticus]|uniref:ClpX C4-type zinc finger protein n=1 Tax=Sandaracinus amylolyticus TaxID=927083 RepID=UPI001F1E28E5|nr:ClpX C4-type zinc finger protein [Sandaracinus amylolyticus]UJR84998.1 Hypothetical protein I5071_70770 [Sandaracinus amylolyticus]